MKVQKLAPTVFPIVFAAVVGRLTRTYALWRAERGATVGVYYPAGLVTIMKTDLQ